MTANGRDLESSDLNFLKSDVSRSPFDFGYISKSLPFPEIAGCLEPCGISGNGQELEKLFLPTSHHPINHKTKWQK